MIDEVENLFQFVFNSKERKRRRTNRAANCIMSLESKKMKSESDCTAGTLVKKGGAESIDEKLKRQNQYFPY